MDGAFDTYGGEEKCVKVWWEKDKLEDLRLDETTISTYVLKK
jgi:hypothetical protein